MKKNELDKDQGLRLAVKHKTEASEKMTLPEDFTDRLMLRIEQQHEQPKRRHYWAYLGTAIAVAASILLLLTLHYTQNTANNDKGTVIAERTEQQKQPSKPESTGRDGHTSQQAELQGNTVNAPKVKQTPMIAQENPGVSKTTAVSQRPNAATTVREIPNGISTTDSLEYYIDKIERELTQVDESLYIEKMNKVIRADDRLQRIVNSYILHNLDKEGRPQTADNMYNLKTEQDEK